MCRNWGDQYNVLHRINVTVHNKLLSRLMITINRMCMCDVEICISLIMDMVCRTYIAHKVDLVYGREMQWKMWYRNTHHKHWKKYLNFWNVVRWSCSLKSYFRFGWLLWKRFVYMDAHFMNVLSYSHSSGMFFFVSLCMWSIKGELKGVFLS